MKIDIVLVGAGSRDFGPATVRDIMLSDALCGQDLGVTLMDVDAGSLARTVRYAERVAGVLGRECRIRGTTDLEDALGGARFVITSIELRRYFYWAQDFHIPRKHGFAQIYGENGGPGGLFHALRNMGPLVEIARTMERICPDAWMINYTNPLTKLCEALTRLTTLEVVGLCHGVFAGIEQLARLIGIPEDRLDARACGLNHFTWFQSIRDRETGEDLYPRLRERERRAHWLADWDDIALSRILLRTFGLYPSPGTNHIGEYLGWSAEFLASSALQFFYDPRDGHPWDTGTVPTWIYHLGDRPTEMPLFSGEEGSASAVEADAGSQGLPTVGADSDNPEEGSFTTERQARRSNADAEPLSRDAICASGELAVPIVEGLACGVTHELAAVNVRNDGAIPGLRDEAVVEVPATVDGGGLRPQRMEPLPEAVLALLRTQTSINELLVRAFREGSRDILLQALLLDPTTRSYRSAVALVDELCGLQADVLPSLTWANPRRP